MSKQQIKRYERVADGINGPFTFEFDLPEGAVILGGEAWPGIGFLRLVVDACVEVDAPTTKTRLLLAAEGDELPDLDGTFACHVIVYGVDGRSTAYLFDDLREPESESANA